MSHTTTHRLANHHAGADTTEAFMEQENNSLHMQLLAQTKAMKEVSVWRIGRGGG
jgi:hypothetical protein